MTNALAIKELQEQLSKLKADKQRLLEGPPERLKEWIASDEPFMSPTDARLGAIEKAILYVEQEIERFSKLDPKAKRQA